MYSTKKIVYKKLWQSVTCNNDGSPSQAYYNLIILTI